jgi:hypothetical protein
MLRHDRGVLQWDMLCLRPDVREWKLLSLGPSLRWVLLSLRRDVLQWQVLLLGPDMLRHNVLYLNPVL